MIEQRKIWQVVKGLEENLSDAERDLGEIRATLLVNFNGSRDGMPNIVNESYSTIGMLVTVLDHYMKFSSTEKT